MKKIGFITSGADSVLIPKEDTKIESLAKDLIEQNKGRRSSIVIVAEGDDGGGTQQIMNLIKPLMQGYSLRYSVLGHIQRGGRPSAFDRMLATRMGAFTVECLLEDKTNIMIGADGDELKTFPLKEVIQITAHPDMTKLKMLLKLRTSE